MSHTTLMHSIRFILLFGAGWAFQSTVRKLWGIQAEMLVALAAIIVLLVTWK